MKRLILIVVIGFLLCGVILPGIEDFLFDVSNKKEVKELLRRENDLEKIKNFIALKNKKITAEERKFIAQQIQKNADLYNVDTRLIVAIICQESKFNRKAQSPVGAQGLMQLMPSTAKSMAKKLKKQNYDLKNPADNILLGTFYLSELKKIYDNDINLVLAHYNGGYRQASVYKRFKYFDILRLFFMNSETYNYVKKVRQFRREFSKNR